MNIEKGLAVEWEGKAATVVGGSNLQAYIRLASGPPFWVSPKTLRVPGERVADRPDEVNKLVAVAAEESLADELTLESGLFTDEADTGAR